MTVNEPSISESRSRRPRTNRVTPFGRLEATSARGSLMGNRGILHDNAGQLGKARWRHRSWITCLLEFKSRHRTINTPGEYTELFFHDEVVALAAGHRPCAQCRPQAYDRYKDAWRKAHDLGPSVRLTAPEIDTELHLARIDQKGGQITHQARVRDLPDGTFMTAQGFPDRALLLWQGKAYHWNHNGYQEPHNVCLETIVRVLTPLPHVRILASGYIPACLATGYS